MKWDTITEQVNPGAWKCLSNLCLFRLFPFVERDVSNTMKLAFLGAFMCPNIIETLSNSEWMKQCKGSETEGARNSVSV